MKKILIYLTFMIMGIMSTSVFAKSVSHNGVCFWDDLRGGTQYVSVNYYDDRGQYPTDRSFRLNINNRKHFVPVDKTSLHIFKIHPRGWYHSMKLKSHDISVGNTVWLYGRGKSRHVVVLQGNYCKK